MLVGRAPGFVQLGGELDVIGAGFAADGCDLGEDLVALGVAGGDGFSVVGDGASGVGSVAAGGFDLGLGAGGFWCRIWGLGCVFHRAVMLAREGVENELWGVGLRVSELVFFWFGF